MCPVLKWTLVLKQTFILEESYHWSNQYSCEGSGAWVWLFWPPPHPWPPPSVHCPSHWTNHQTSHHPNLALCHNTCSCTLTLLPEKIITLKNRDLSRISNQDIAMCIVRQHSRGPGHYTYTPHQQQNIVTRYHNICRISHPATMQ